MGLIAIGDIHGCAKSLDALLDRLELSDDDHLIFVGDYIDRGPDSKGVIDRLLKLDEEHECTFLRGNHEALMLGYLDTRAIHLWQVNGGGETLRSYVQNGQADINIPDEHKEFVRNTRMYYETDDYLFVHAGLKANHSVEDNLESFDEEVFLWERGHLEASDYAWDKTVVCGHTPRPEPINRDQLIMIDTGCVYHMQPGMGRLTAVRLPEREFIDVEYAD